MSEAADNLLERVLSLEEEDRAALAGALIESLHGEVDAGTEAAWGAEIQRRVAELEAHTVDTIPWRKVRDRLFSGFE